MILGPGQIAQTPDPLRRAEASLLADTGAAGAAWCGRAATALYLAYRLAGSESEVILPALSCATPANAALLASCRPRFADVDPATGLLTLESVQARWTERTRAVVFIHLYGQAADLTELAAWCRARQVLLIEDNAQAQGARAGGRPIGSWGDLAVYSFNPTKVLEAGGAALLVRSAALLEALRAELDRLRLPQVEPGHAAQLASSYRNLHHGLVGLLRLRPRCPIADLFLKLRGEYDPLLLRPLADPQPLAEAWDRLPALLEHRRRNAARYADALAGGPWLLLNGWRDSGVCWRYTLLVDFPEQVVAFSEAVRRDGFHVSNLYWPLPPFFHPEDTCPQAEAFARRVVNLWLDDRTTPEAVAACAASLWRQARAMGRTGPAVPRRCPS